MEAFEPDTVSASIYGLLSLRSFFPGDEGCNYGVYGLLILRS